MAIWSHDEFSDAASSTRAYRVLQCMVIFKDFVDYHYIRFSKELRCTNLLPILE
jgi:hypothetical protein